MAYIIYLGNPSCLASPLFKASACWTPPAAGRQRLSCPSKDVAFWVVHRKEVVIRRARTWVVLKTMVPFGVPEILSAVLF